MPRLARPTKIRGRPSMKRRHFYETRMDLVNQINSKMVQMPNPSGIQTNRKLNPKQPLPPLSSLHHSLLAPKVQPSSNNLIQPTSTFNSKKGQLINRNYPNNGKLLMSSEGVFYNNPNSTKTVATIDLTNNDMMAPLILHNENNNPIQNMKNSRTLICSECGHSSLPQKKIYKCTDCHKSSHLSCHGFWVNDPMFPATWQCPDCISCFYCQKKSHDRLMACASCSQAYHSLCHQPNISKEIQDSSPWICQSCTEKGILLVDIMDPETYNNHVGEIRPLIEDNCSGPPPLGDPQQSPEEKIVNMEITEGDLGELRMSHSSSIITKDECTLNLSSKSDSTSPNNITSLNNNLKFSPKINSDDKFEANMATTSNNNTPAVVNVSSASLLLSASISGDMDLTETDVNTWSTHNVAHWLRSMGFHREADIFMEQEIDGSSLLFMKSIDLFSQMDIKLGPAIKIHEKLKRIQQKSNATRKF